MSDDSATTAPLNLPSTAPPVKRGTSTTEFYSAWFVKILGAVMASGLLGNGEASRIVGGLMALMAQLGYTASRTLVKSAAPALAMILVLVFGASSMTGCGASQQQTTLTAALATTDAARAAFLAYDAKHQADIVAAAKTKDDGAAALAVWRKEQDMARIIIDSAYRAIAAYSVLKDDPTSLQNLNSALGMIVSEFAAIGIK